MKHLPQLQINIKEHITIFLLSAILSKSDWIRVVRDLFTYEGMKEWNWVVGS